jgi:hypothetical protein
VETSNFSVFSPRLLRANARSAPCTGPKELNSVSNDRELNSQSFETKFSLFGAPKLKTLRVEGAHGNFEPFWKL